MESKKVGLIFPGQGAQYVGMGRELYESFPAAREAFDAAGVVLGFDLKKIIFEGPEDVLRQTQYTQPALFVTSIAAYQAFSGSFPGEGIDYLYAGHSLGEYSALCAAGAFTLEDGIRLVRARGEFIRLASEKNPGSMAAVLGLTAEQVQELCRAAAAEGGRCEAVNYNAPGQVVIAGTTDAVNRAVAAAPGRGAAKTILLNVSGPFHSSLMTPAAEMMRETLKTYALADTRGPVIMNVDARPVTTGSEISGKLVSQIDHPVRWEDSIRQMIGAGCGTFIELGPQRVLSGLLRRIDRAAKSYSVEDAATLARTLEGLRAG